MVIGNLPLVNRAKSDTSLLPRGPRCAIRHRRRRTRGPIRRPGPYRDSLAQDTGGVNAVTEAACAVYFFARLAHAPVYIFNVPVLQPVTFMIGLGAVLVLAYQLVA